MSKINDNTHNTNRNITASVSAACTTLKVDVFFTLDKIKRGREKGIKSAFALSSYLTPDGRALNAVVTWCA